MPSSPNRTGESASQPESILNRRFLELGTKYQISHTVQLYDCFPFGRPTEKGRAQLDEGMVVTVSRIAQEFIEVEFSRNGSTVNICVPNTEAKRIYIDVPVTHPTISVTNVRQKFSGEIHQVLEPRAT